MKTLFIAGFAAALIGCTSTTRPTTTTTTTARTAEQTSAGPKSVYTGHDIDRSGRASTGSALRTLDPTISGGGN